MKTSENNPLRIAELPLGKGIIGMTLCPGKQDAAALYGPCERSLKLDLQVIKDWGAGVIVTLLESWELTCLKVEALPETVQAYGMSWCHFSLKDGGPLEYQGDGFVEHGFDRWSVPCVLLRLFLQTGGRILIHCRGGLGRTGTLAARLLIEEGQDAETAIKTVRSVRPGAIETESQKRYLREFYQQSGHAYRERT
jgi:protein-tyrosine phosphatase